ncbi:hypothetical protein M406DRAFT_358621 [Cryphonectria parasitica EP155]|uniref:Uncharacterized protein n=1 Tax=Cryphonectria parasitica (strain ATCC 38755 / EP155) TaxID=660469 RepID=A0A9P4XSX7_CRYP1|nr:uncharacterized protein M406DRAFT_358621 [Cryphonectria parasitica EP155]KAF3760379.1 hypothetical protein M406DRAFT_358621 [Cryphonectria parasitica EP155]
MESLFDTQNTRHSRSQQRADTRERRGCRRQTKNPVLRYCTPPAAKIKQNKQKIRHAPPGQARATTSYALCTT